MSRKWDADQVVRENRVNLPTYGVYFLAGIAIARFQAYAIQFIEWLQPFMYAAYGVWAVLALLCCLSCWMNRLKGEPPIQQGEAITIFLLFGFIVVCAIGFALEDVRLGG